MDKPNNTGPLKGIRVIDLSSVLLGPFATQTLGDWGADVIKVESLEGDVMRFNGVSRNRGMGSIFLATNRNKKSIALNLKSPEGLALLNRMLQDADIFVSNMRVEALERLGIGYEAASRLNPRLVYCVATGFDQDGPCRNKPAFDDTIQAECGLLGLGLRPGSQPVFPPSLIADKTAGLALINALLAALLHRERAGAGQYVEVPMFETMVAFTLTEHLGGLSFEPAAGAAGYTRLLEGRRPIPTADGFVTMLPYSVLDWAELYRAAGRDDLAGQTEGMDRKAMNDNYASLYENLAAVTHGKTSRQWLDICAALDISAAPIYRVEELPRHPQLEAVKLFTEASHPSEGAIRYVRPTTKFSASPASVRSHAPLLGQHTQEILEGLGCSPEDIEALEQRGVVKRGGPTP